MEIISFKMVKKIACTIYAGIRSPDTRGVPGTTGEKRVTGIFPGNYPRIFKHPDFKSGMVWYSITKRKFHLLVTDVFWKYQVQ